MKRGGEIEAQKEKGSEEATYCAKKNYKLIGETSAIILHNGPL